MNPRSPKRTLSPWNLLYFAIGLFLLYFLLRKTDFQSLLQLILQIKPEYLLLGALIYFCKALTRAARFTRVNRRTQPAFWRMLRLSLASSLASQILPLKLGELSYVYLLKMDHRTELSRGLSSLVVIRLFDLLAISLLFVIITLFSGLSAGLSVYFYSILAFMALLMVGIALLLFFARRGESFLQWTFGLPIFLHLPAKITPLLSKIRQALANLFDELCQYQPREYAEWTALAALEWFINYLTYHVILVGLGFTPSFFTTVASVTFAALASVLPVNSFGNFGTQEAGWATAMLLSGFSQAVAITTAFATHLLTLAYMLLFGGISWVSYLFGRKR